MNSTLNDLNQAEQTARDSGKRFESALQDLSGSVEQVFDEVSVNVMPIIETVRHPGPVVGQLVSTAEDYVKDAQGKLENYARVRAEQVKIEFRDSLHEFVDDAESRLTKSVERVGNTIATAVEAIDSRPILTWAALLLAGGGIGYLYGRANRSSKEVLDVSLDTRKPLLSTDAEAVA